MTCGPRSLFALVICCSPVYATAVFASFASGTSTSQPFTLNGISGTLSVALGPQAAAATGLLGTFNPTGSANFPDFFFPVPPANLPWLAINVDGVSQAPTDIIATFTLQFDSPIQFLNLNFLNLDTATYIFTSATGPDGSPIPFLFGRFTVPGENAAFDVGLGLIGGQFAVNTDPRAEQNAGCESNAGGNPSGACGTVTGDGPFRSLTWVARDSNTGAGGDMNGFQMSVFLPSPVPEPGTFSLMFLAAILLIAKRTRIRSFLQTRRR